MESDFDNRLISREKELDSLETAWEQNGYPIFVIHGPKLVGKSQLVRIFLRRTLEGEDCHVIEIDFRKIRSIKEFEYFLFNNEVFTTDHTNCAKDPSSGGEPVACFDCTRTLEKEIRSMGNKRIIFSLDNVEKVDKSDRTCEDTYDLAMRLYLLDLVRNNTRNVRLLISSTIKLAFASVRACQFHIEALDDDRSLSLLKTVTKVTGEDAVLKQVCYICGGLPLAIVSAGLLIEDPLWTAADVLELMLGITLDVLSRNTLSSADAVEFNMNKDFESLCKESQEHLLTLAAIVCDESGVGGQSVADMAKFYGYKGEPKDLPFFKWNVLCPLYNRNLVNFDSSSQTVSISNIMMEKFITASKYIPEERREHISRKIKKLKGEQGAPADKNQNPVKEDDTQVPGIDKSSVQNASIEGPDVTSSTVRQAVESQESLNSQDSFKLDSEGGFDNQDFHSQVVLGARTDENENKLSRTLSLESSCEENALFSSLTNVNIKGYAKTPKEEKRVLLEEKKLDPLKEMLHGDNHLRESDPVSSGHEERHRLVARGVSQHTPQTVEDSVVPASSHSQKGQLFTLENTHMINESQNSSSFSNVHVGATHLVNNLDTVSLEDNARQPMTNGIQGRSIRDENRQCRRPEKGEILSIGSTCGSIGLQSNVPKLNFDSLLNSESHTGENVQERPENNAESQGRNSVANQNTEVKQTSISRKPICGLSLL